MNLNKIDLELIKNKMIISKTESVATVLERYEWFQTILKSVKEEVCNKPMQYGLEQQKDIR